MSLTLRSTNPHYQVRTAKARHICYTKLSGMPGGHLCSEIIRPGDEFVAKVKFTLVGMNPRWAGDLMDYCRPCALAKLKCIEPVAKVTQCA